MISVQADWTQVKTFANTRSVSVQYVDFNGNYYISALDGNFSIETLISQEDPENVDLIDFETNYKPTANRKLDATDSDGVFLQRLKVTAAGWSLHYHGLEITTSNLTGAFDMDQNNVDFGFTTVKLYDANGVQITDPLLVSGCVKTVVDWEPTFDYDIIGGDVFMDAAPLTDVRVSVIGVPDIPANMGGNKVFMTGFNLKHVSPLGIHLDGKTPKSTKYNPVYHTNKIRFVFWHDPGVSHTVLVMLNLFKA